LQPTCVLSFTIHSNGMQFVEVVAMMARVFWVVKLSGQNLAVVLFDVCVVTRILGTGDGLMEGN
jgi:hypothetical protein